MGHTPSFGTIIPSLGSRNCWKVLPYIELKLASLQFLPVGPCSSLGYGKSYSLLHTSVFQIFEDINHVPPLKAIISIVILTG